MFQHHDVVEVQLLFAVDFDEAEVVVLNCLHEGVAAIESFLNRLPLVAHIQI